jgi:hypothetical protein
MQNYRVGDGDFAVIKRKESYYKISKLEGARRLIHTSTRMIYENEDAIAVNLLVQSADRVLSDLTKSQSRADIIWDSPIINQQHKVELQNVFRQASNFVKHADKNPNDELEVYDIAEFSEHSLYFTILRYRELSASMTAHMKLFLGYYLLQHPTHGQIEKTLSNGLMNLAAQFKTLTELRRIWKGGALMNLDYNNERLEDCADTNRRSMNSVVK